MVTGAVVIGRNEGERLRRCLASLAGRVEPIVYVDSASTDGSVELARSFGADVVQLDLSTPFTAARARNTGLARALELAPALEFVQFVDGDCEMLPGYLEAAAAAFEDATIGVVAGRLRERNVEASVYNRLCDVEWDGAVGDVDSVGGNAAFRVSVFRAVSGFDPTLIAGEEPELCLRVRRSGSRVVRIDVPMALHDAAMTRFSQWWTRSLRAGYAYAEGAARHGRGPERYYVRPMLRSLVYGFAIPVTVLLTVVPTRGASSLLLAVYPVSAYRAHRSIRGRREARDAWLYGAFVTLAKFPEALGGLKFLYLRLRGRRSGLIEYK